MDKIALRNVFGNELVRLGKKNKRIIVISCDLKSATKTSGFFKIFPERSFEILYLYGKWSQCFLSWHC